MKNIILILLLTLSISVFSQDKDRYARIKALKIAFITEKLDLTESEAQKFWPIYNDFEGEYHKLRRESSSKFRDVDFDAMSEADAKKHLEKMLESDAKRFQFKQQFANDLLKVLPAKKVVLLKATEDAFNKRMMEQFKKRREGLRKNLP